MSTLYGLAEDMAALADLMLDEAEAAQPDATLEQWAREYDFKLASKVDSYGDLYATMKAEALVCEEEAKRLQARAKARRAVMERLAYMAGVAMEQMGVSKLEGVRHTIARQKNGGIAPLIVDDENPDRWPEDLVVTTRALDRGKVRAMLDAGLTLELARVGERGSSIRFK